MYMTPLRKNSSTHETSCQVQDVFVFEIPSAYFAGVRIKESMKAGV